VQEKEIKMSHKLWNWGVDSDGYKYSQFNQYRPGTEFVSSYVAGRGGKYDRMMTFGVQALMKDWVENPLTKSDVDELEAETLEYMGIFNREGFDYVLDKFGGYPPVRLQALREGLMTPTKVPRIQLVNVGGSKTVWATSFLETSVLRNAWYMSAVATRSWTIRQTLRKHLAHTADDLSALDWMFVDFGARGVSSFESGGLGGMAHLVSFNGTDTRCALRFAKKYYAAGVVGNSVRATEHSTMTSWGGEAGEPEAMEAFLRNNLRPGVTIACVSDSYDIWRAVTSYWGDRFRKTIMESGGRLVVRPDSGDPIATPVHCIELLGERFGYTVNGKGFKVLHPSVRVLQGDGIDEDMVGIICEELIRKGWSVENIVFGMGGNLLQKIDRDTCKDAMKASAGYHPDFGWFDIYKDPLEDKTKTSFKGRQAVVAVTGAHGVGYLAVREDGIRSDQVNLLEDVYVPGRLVREQTFDNIREIARR
jgi:nicotinamide phosphoribosyltransferase